MSSLKCFIGFDPRQPVAYQVCAQSVWEHASKPVSITRLDLRTLPIQRRGLTAFTYSRFLAPYLCDFQGEALFLDSDILVRCDINELRDTALYPDTNVSMVMHEGREKFERASVMLFQNNQCGHLMPHYIDDPRNALFDFKWASNPAALPKEYNHLIGYQPPNPDAKIVHFTAGIPVWEETKNCEFAKEWWAIFKRMNSSVGFEELMGNSVHKERLQMGAK